MCTQTIQVDVQRFKVPVRVVVSLLIALIRAYQAVLSPLLIGSCKFCPTCSQYAAEALRRHGPVKGLWLGTKRLCRCHPFSPGGIDPVPY